MFPFPPNIPLHCVLQSRTDALSFIDMLRWIQKAQTAAAAMALIILTPLQYREISSDDALKFADYSNVSYDMIADGSQAIWLASRWVHRGAQMSDQSIK